MQSCIFTLIESFDRWYLDLVVWITGGRRIKGRGWGDEKCDREAQDGGDVNPICGLVVKHLCCMN